MPPLEALPVAYLPGANGRGSTWRAIAERLARRRPPLLCDYAAHDGEGRPIDSAGELARCLLSSLPERCDVISISAGAAVALELALAEPARVRRLVLVTPASGVEIAKLGGLELYDAAGELAAGWLFAERALSGARLASLSAPTLVVCGERDLIAPPAVGEHLLRCLPAARLEVVAAATHDLELEQPDLLASLIEAHLRR